MPTGLKQWAIEVGLPVSLEAAIREYRSEQDTEETVNDLIKFYKTNSAKRKQEFDTKFIKVIEYGEKNDEDKEDIVTNLKQITDEIVAYYNQGPDLPTTPIEAIKEYTGKDAQQLITYWGILGNEDKSELNALYSGLLIDPSRSKMEKIQDLMNFVSSFRLNIANYFPSPFIKLFREELKGEQDVDLMLSVEQFFNSLDSGTQKVYNDEVLKIRNISNSIQRKNANLATIIRVLKGYSQATSNTKADFLTLKLTQTLTPQEGPKSAAQLEEEARRRKEEQALLLAQQGFNVAGKGAQQQEAGAQPSTLSGKVQAIGEADLNPFKPLTIDAISTRMKNLLPLNKKGEINTTQFYTQLIDKYLDMKLIEPSKEEAKEEEKDKLNQDIEVVLLNEIVEHMLRVGGFNPFATSRGTIESDSQFYKFENFDQLVERLRRIFSFIADRRGFPNYEQYILDTKGKIAASKSLTKAFQVDEADKPLSFLSRVKLIKR